MSSPEGIPGESKNLGQQEQAPPEASWRERLRTRHIVPVIPRLADRRSLPLSFLQERLWLLDQLEPHTPTYNIPFALRLTGLLNEDALRQALETIRDRHEILRTRIAIRDGQPALDVSPHLALDLRVTDLSKPAPEVARVSRPCGDMAKMAMPTETDRESQARSLATEEALRPFDLARDPAWRGTLLRLDEQEHVLILVFHHIACDASSRQIFRDEFARLYGALSTGRLPDLVELPIQYSDFTHWQRQRAGGERLEGEVSYWKQQLAGCIPLDLPQDRARPSIPSHRGGRTEVILPEPLADTLKGLGRQENATLFMSLLAAFQVLLSRYTGSEDIIAASMAGGRDWVETEGLIGPFLNTFILRTELRGNPTFRELLGRVRETCRGAYSHQNLPFDQLPGILGSGHGTSIAPFFQVVFNLENLPEKRVELACLRVEEFEFEFPVTPYDLTLDVLTQGRELKCVFAYNADLFDQGTIERMAAHYRTLLEGIVADPDGRIASLPLLTPAERHQILVEWNQTAVEYPRNATLQELFEAQAQQRPEAVALTFADQSLTYGELNRKANRLAHQLRGWGVGLETTVGLLLERSLDMVVALLAILKAGGTCVPLDPTYPKERRAFMLEDSGIHLLLTHEKLRCGLPQGDIRVVCLDRLEDPCPTGDHDNLQIGAKADHVACLFYTSGSTGKPKGVEVLHRGMVRLVCGSDYIRFGPDEVFLQRSSVSFDGITVELWGPLLHGGRCVLSPNRVPGMAQLRTVIKEENVTTVHLTPSMFNLVLDNAPDVLLPVRQLILGGEALSVPHVSRALSLLPATQLVNGYGPTECATFACCYPIPRTRSPAARSIPIGRPIANTQVYILDPSLQPVPVGVTGELYIGGDGVARGYRDRPEINSQKFVPDPFSAEAGARLYKTGDLGRYLPDGNIEFLGRHDNQVKIRGFRVELGEIESSLAKHPAVSAAAAAVREEVPGDKRLVAYVVPRKEAKPPASNALRDFLKAKLPDYMVPSDFFTLEELPMTPSGKLDRRALPVISRARRAEETLVPPRNWQQSHVVRIWEEILNVRPIGIEDDFFDLGGNSLDAVRMMNRIEDAFGQSLPLATLFAKATIKHLVECVQTESLRNVRSAIVPVHTGGSYPPFYFLHGDLWGGIYCRKLAQLLGDEQPFYGVMPNGFDGKPLHPTIEAMAEENIRLLLDFQPQGPYLLGGYCSGGMIAYEMAGRLEERGLEVGTVIMLESGVPRYFGWLKALVHSGGALIRLDADAQAHVYSRLRNYMVRIYGAYHRGYKALLTLFWQTVRKKVLRLAGTPPEELGIPGPVFEDPVLSQRYRHTAYTLMEYRPQPYHGRVVLLRTKSSGDSRPGDPTAGWGKLAPNLEVYELPGDHVTCLTENAEVVAKHIRRCLGEYYAAAQTTLAQDICR